MQVIALDERTNDRSLVMTSSFTNIVLAARGLGLLRDADGYRALCRNLSARADALLKASFDPLARWPRETSGGWCSWAADRGSARRASPPSR